MLLKLIRRIRSIPEPRISREQAIQLAIAEAMRHNNGEWSQPTGATRPPRADEHLRYWWVWLEPDIRPSRVAKIDNQTGAVLLYDFPPR
ncbi:MAG TPA: hypothetical protein VF777_02380 [Phycisphaerales bacterium]